MHLLCTSGGSLNKVAPLFSSDNSHVIVAQGPGLIILDAQDLRVVRRLRETPKQRATDKASTLPLDAPESVITAMALNPLNKEEVFAGCLAGYIFRWNFVRGELVTVTPTKIRIQRMFSAPACTMHDWVFVAGKVLGGPVDMAAKRQKVYGIRASNFKATVVRLLIELDPTLDVAAAVSQDGRRLVGAGWNKILNWDIVDDEHREHVQELRIQGTVSKLAVHPSESTVCWCDERGELRVKNIDADQATQSRDAQMHWHAQAPNDMLMTPDGLRLLTGGGEGVLVSWAFDPPGKTFLPHLGSPIVGIASSSTGNAYAVLLECNSVLLITPGAMKPIARFDCLKSDAEPTSHPLNGLVKDPRNPSAILLNSIPGELQSFDPIRNCSYGKDIDVCGQNIVKRGKDGQALLQSDVYGLAFSVDGVWMATYERRNALECSLRYDVLRFWHLKDGGVSGEFELVDTIENPHKDVLYHITFSPTLHKGLYRCVTVGADCVAKIWSNSNVRIDRVDVLTGKALSKATWSHLKSISVRSLPCRAAAFSPDGSVLAISFGLGLELFDALSFKPLGSLCAMQGNGLIKEVVFVEDYLVAIDESSLYSWHVTSLCPIWALKFPSVRSLTIHPNGTICTVIVTVTNPEGAKRSSSLLFRPESGIPTDYYHHSGELVGCEFVTTAVKGEHALAHLDARNRILVCGFTSKVRLPKPAETNKYIEDRKTLLSQTLADALSKTPSGPRTRTLQPQIILPQVNNAKLFMSHLPSHLLPGMLEAFEHFIHLKLPVRSH